MRAATLSLCELPPSCEPPEGCKDVHGMVVVLVSLAHYTPPPLFVYPLALSQGAGKSFNLELCCKVMGVQPIIVSAGELEDELAGEPGRRLRERYRFAARYSLSAGVATCLIINDLDAGVGRYANTDVTINNQNVQGTLMAICDDPNKVCDLLCQPVGWWLQACQLECSRTTYEAGNSHE